jgi:hypothetical protein
MATESSPFPPLLELVYQVVQGFDLVQSIHFQNLALLPKNLVMSEIVPIREIIPFAFAIELLD